MYPTPDSTPSDDPGSRKAEETAKELEALSTAFVHALNARDFDFNKSGSAREVSRHIAPTWKAQLDTRPQQERPLSWDEQRQAWRERALDHPDVYFDVVQVTSDVNEENGHAKVYLDMEVSGIGHVLLHAMNEVRWRRTRGTWLCYYVIGMRGTPGNAGLG